MSSVVPTPLAQQNNFSPVRPGEWEAVNEPLYDFQTYALAGTTQSYRFFTTPVGQSSKSYADTNMELAGQLSAGVAFEVRAIEIAVLPSINPSVAATVPTTTAGVAAFVIDGTQSIGALPFDVERIRPDAGVDTRPLELATLFELLEQLFDVVRVAVLSDRDFEVELRVDRVRMRPSDVEGDAGRQRMRDVVGERLQLGPGQLAQVRRIVDRFKQGSHRVQLSRSTTMMAKACKARVSRRPLAANAASACARWKKCLAVPIVPCTSTSPGPCPIL